MTNPLYAYEYIPKPGEKFDAYNRASSRRNRFGPFVCVFRGKRAGKRCVESAECKFWLDVWWFEKVEE